MHHIHMLVASTRRRSALQLGALGGLVEGSLQRLAVHSQLERSILPPAARAVAEQPQLHARLGQLGGRQDVEGCTLPAATRTRVDIDRRLAARRLLPLDAARGLVPRVEEDHLG